MRTLPGLSLCLAMTLPAWAEDPMLSGPPARVRMTVDALNYASHRFDMGVVTDDWSASHRFELNVLAEPPGFRRAEPTGGGYFFYEERDWQGVARASADYWCWGFGMQGGALIRLTPPDRGAQFALVPHVRAGIGWQDLSVRGLPITGGGTTTTYDLSAGAGRVEVAAGIDLRVTIGRRLEIVFGGGADYWSGASVYVGAGTGGLSAGVGVSGNRYNFTGSNTFARFGVGVRL